MTLNTSGGISLAGTTSNASIEQEIDGSLYASPYTSGIAMNDAAFRAMVDKPTSGTSISMGDFYGASFAQVSVTFGGFWSSGKYYYVYNQVDRCNVNLARVGAQTAVGTPRSYVAGAGLYTTGVFYAGNGSNKVTRINSSGALIGSETTVGTARDSAGGAQADASTAVFYGGSPGGITVVNTVTRINSSGALIGSETSAGSLVMQKAGAGLTTASTAVFYGGRYGGSIYATVTRINASGTLIGNESVMNSAKYMNSGAGVYTTAIFYGGLDNNSQLFGTVLRVNSSGSIIGSETTVSPASYTGAGCALYNYGIFNHPGGIIKINTSGTSVATGSSLVAGNNFFGAAGIN